MIDSQTAIDELERAVNPTGIKRSQIPMSGIHDFSEIPPERQPTYLPPMPEKPPVVEVVSGPEVVSRPEERIFILPELLKVLINHLKSGKSKLARFELNHISPDNVRAKLDELLVSGVFDVKEHDEALRIINGSNPQIDIPIPNQPDVSPGPELLPKTEEIEPVVEVKNEMPEAQEVVRVSPEPIPVVSLEQKPEPPPIFQEPVSTPVLAAETPERIETPNELAQARSEFATLLSARIRKNHNAVTQIGKLFAALGAKGRKAPLPRQSAELMAAEARYIERQKEVNPDFVPDTSGSLEESFKGEEAYKHRLLTKAMRLIGVEIPERVAPNADGLLEEEPVAKEAEGSTGPEILKDDTLRPDHSDSEATAPQPVPETPGIENDNAEEVRLSADFDGKKVEIIQNTKLNTVVMLLDGKKFAQGEIGKNGPKVKLLKESDIRSGFLFPATIYEKVFRSKEIKGALRGLSATK